MTHFTDENPVQFLSQQQGFVLLDLWAPWCVPCKALEPVLDKLAADYASALKMIKVNIDNYNKISGELNVRSLPTLILFQDGREVARKNGRVGKADLENWLIQHGCQRDSGEPVYLHKSGDWLSFYNDQRVRDLFTRELRSLSERYRHSREVTVGEVTAGNLLYAIDYGNNYLSRVFGLPETFLHFFAFLSFQEAGEINQLAENIKAGKDYSLIPLRSIRQWLQEELLKSLCIDISHPLQKLTGAWCQAAGEVIDGKPVLLSAWQDIASEATVCQDKCPPGRQAESLLASFLFRHSPPLTVDNGSQIADFSRVSYTFYECQYLLAAGRNVRDTDDIRQERMDWITQKVAADKASGRDISHQGYGESLFSLWAEQNEENREFLRQERLIQQRITEGDNYRRLKDYFISLL